MGYPSLLEDSRKGLEEYLDTLNLRIRDSEDSSQIARLMALSRQCKNMLGQMRRLIDAAQDPKLDLVAENIQLRQDNVRVGENNRDFRKELRKTQIELQNERDQRRRCEFELKQLEKAVAADPDKLNKMIEHHSRPADIEFFKPGEQKRFKTR